MVWGCVATLTALVKSYTGLFVVRFFLGFVEAPFYPGALYILSLFYTRKEIATRVSILYAGTTLILQSPLPTSCHVRKSLNNSRKYIRSVLCRTDCGCHFRHSR